MTKKIIEAANIKEGQIVLDAGCGVGSIAYEIALCFPESLVLGINIVPLQIQVADQFKQKGKIGNLFYLLNSFDEMALPSESFDRIE
jgi:ubiquinone/menaquinone biosynthesis C-methylase UbiE